MTTNRASRNNRNTGRKKTSKIWHVNFLGEVVPLTMRHFWCVRPVMAPLRRLPPLGRRSRRQCSRLCTVTSRFWHDQRSTSTGHTSSSSSSFSSSSSSSSYYFFFFIIVTLIIIFIIFIIIVIINIIIIITIIIITLTSSTWASQERKFQTWKPMAYRAKKTCAYRMWASAACVARTIFWHRAFHLMSSHFISSRILFPFLNFFQLMSSHVFSPLLSWSQLFSHHFSPDVFLSLLSSIQSVSTFLGSSLLICSSQLFFLILRLLLLILFSSARFSSSSPHLTSALLSSSSSHLFPCQKTSAHLRPLGATIPICDLQAASCKRP